MMNFRCIAVVFLWLVCSTGLGFSLSSRVFKPSQGTLDYMTVEEVDHVREAQPIDLRIKVFMKIAERRLLAAEDPQAAQLKRDESDWGSLPAGSQADKLKQYNRAIEETILNFEEAYDRNPKDERLLKALNIFGEHIAKHLQRLEGLQSQLVDDAARRVLEQVLDDLKLAYEDARQSEEQLKLEHEQRKKDKKKS